MKIQSSLNIYHHLDNKSYKIERYDETNFKNSKAVSKATYPKQHFLPIAVLNNSEHSSNETPNFVQENGFFRKVTPIQLHQEESLCKIFSMCLT